MSYDCEIFEAYQYEVFYFSDKIFVRRVADFCYA